jgi:hypothetical protein
VHDVEAGHRLEQLAGHVIGRAGAGRRVIELPGLGLRERNQLLQRSGLHVGIHDEHEIRIVDRRDRREIAHQRERLVRHQRLVDRVRVRHQQQRVAVGGALRNDLGADDRAAAGTVFDDERLAHGLLQALREEARVDVGRAAGRERHDDLDRPRRIVVGGRIDRDGGEQGSQGETKVTHGRFLD